MIRAMVSSHRPPREPAIYAAIMTSVGHGGLPQFAYESVIAWAAVSDGFPEVKGLILWEGKQVFADDLDNFCGYTRRVCGGRDDEAFLEEARKLVMRRGEGL